MSITLDQVTKHYGGVPVVNDVSLDIGDGEFFVLLGPSGSGKSTLLRAIAGLTGVDHGRIALHGRDVTHVAARKRGVGLVFQNYALFRHMTVAENIEFALRVRHVRARDRKSTRLNSSHPSISYAVFCLKKKTLEISGPATATRVCFV